METLSKTNVNLKDSEISTSEQDLLLAAEIGQALLERNKELEMLLKNTQEYAEEQEEKAKFYYNQVESLREEKVLCTQFYEQLEAANQRLADKYKQYKNNCKLLTGKNDYLWEHIHLLEKKNEELRVELNNLNTEANTNENNVGKPIKENSQTADVISIENESIDSILLQDEEKQFDDIKKLEKQVDQLNLYISELKVQLNIIRLQKEEVELNLESILHENDILQKKVTSLNQEVREWETFVHREENYKLIAKAFSPKHFIELDDNKDACKKIFMVKAKSCEFLNKSKQCPNERESNNTLFSQNSSSFLRELDTDYADLVRRYEELLEKFHNKEKLNENPEKVRKVQRAIQTLSFDFTSKISPMTPLKNLFATPNESLNTNLELIENNDHSESLTVFPDTSMNNHLDYKKIFSEIFIKLNESKRI
ncbi:cerebellar degeneration-related protein 2-like isoform X1 [Hydra vulgaris]|uniref:Cerebellar degeneration-related protein 2-like isoform X1 n=2 Tax=Hydra vulgaris TaxID=6087 RepID=A0ABM4CCM5_HYDVU